MSFISRRSLLLLCCRVDWMRGSKSSLSYAFSTVPGTLDFQKQASWTARNHRSCDRCHGTGKVLLPPSKKVLNAYEFRCSKIAKKTRTSSSIELPLPPQSRTGKCASCNGIGVVVKSIPSSSTTDLDNEDVIESGVKGSDDGHGVVVVGGGIGGFALALALQQRGIHVRVFEKDECFNQRSQGYGLTMQQGARTLRQLGYSYEDIGNLGVTSTSHYSFLPDKTVLGAYGKALLDKEVEGKHRINVHLPRQQLRELLLDALLPNTVFWGHQFERYKVRTGGDGLEVTFTRTSQQPPVAEEESASSSNASKRDSSTQIVVGGDILVGCDGIWSMVRKQKLKKHDVVSDARYLGVMVVLGRGRVQHDLTSTNPESCSVFQTLDGNTRIYAMPFSPTIDTPTHELVLGETMWQLSFPVEESVAKQLGGAGGQALLDEAMRRCGSWHSPIPELLLSTQVEDVTGYPAYDRTPLEPGDLSRVHASNMDEEVIDDCGRLVTLLGDAAHPMSPFKGQGANQALMDSIELARCLNKVKVHLTPRLMKSSDDNKVIAGGQSVSKLSSIDRALLNFEQEMLSRSKLKVEASADASRFLHSQAAASAVENVSRASAAKAWLATDQKENI